VRCLLGAEPGDLITDRQSYVTIYTDIAKERMKNNQCPACGKPKSEWNRRTDWRCCSKECTEVFWKEHDKSLSWEIIRYRVFKRDKGVCAMCGEQMTWEFDGKQIPNDSQLVCDHIKPLAMDGEMWDMENLQTLCIECNKKKTAEDLANIAEYKKVNNKKKLHKTFKNIYIL